MNSVIISSNIFLSSYGFQSQSLTKNFVKEGKEKATKYGNDILKSNNTQIKEDTGDLKQKNQL